MGTATSRALAVALAALLLAGCGTSASAGGSSRAHTSATGGSAQGGPATGRSAPGGPATGGSGAFAWLSPGAPPAGWAVARISSGATMPYPPGWRLRAGDRGTATAVRLNDHGRIVGYLNLTPQQGSETPATWARFRVDHNGDEGDRNVKTLASAGGLRFRSGRGACVKDSYATKTGAAYVELACLVPGAVIVGAAPPSAWPSVAPMLERAIAGFTA